MSVSTTSFSKSSTNKRGSARRSPSSNLPRPFEAKAGLGSGRTIMERISVLATKGFIKFPQRRRLRAQTAERSKYGYMCIRGMELQTMKGLVRVLPTYYKDEHTGSFLPVENPDIWIDHEGGERLRQTLFSRMRNVVRRMQNPAFCKSVRILVLNKINMLSQIPECRMQLSHLVRIPRKSCSRPGYEYTVSARMLANRLNT